MEQGNALCKWLVCKLFVLNIFRGTGLLGILAFDAPKLHLLMNFIWQPVCNTTSDLERDKWWMEVIGGFLWLFSPSLFLFFYERRRIYNRGLTSLIKGVAFFSQLCVFMAEPLLLKCNHSNLRLWFPIERISSPSFPERNLLLTVQPGFGVSHPLPFPWSLQSADTGFSILRVVRIFLL